MTENQVPQYEEFIFESLQKMYNELLSLKNNRQKYINSKQISDFYEVFLSYIHDLSQARQTFDRSKDKVDGSITATDTLIEDIWQLLSLCFVTCGLLKSAPATYSSLSAVNKLLSHLKESQTYTMDDLEPIQVRLDEIKDIIDASDGGLADEGEQYEMKSSKKEEESALLHSKLEKSQRALDELKYSFEQIPKDLEPIYRDLLSIRKAVLGYLTGGSESHNLSQAKLKQFLDDAKVKLKKIESKRDEEGKFSSSNATEEQQKTVQMVLNGLIDDCNNFINDISYQKDTHIVADLLDEMHINDSQEPEEAKLALKGFEEIYANLIDIKYKLENLLITRRWTMRETDLYAYQKQLKQIDSRRAQLNKSISNIKEPPTFLRNLRNLQLLILYLLRRCYAIVYKLLESSEPVSESLQPIHNQLSTVRRCLLEIKRVDGLNTLRDIYPFQFKLASLDNLRHDGKFTVNGQIPVGQGTLNALLSECFDILHELKIELEEKEEAAESSDTQNNAGVRSEYVTDTDDIDSDDEVEKKRNRYVGFNEADYDRDSESCLSDEGYDDSGYESNDYY